MTSVPTPPEIEVREPLADLPAWAACFRTAPIAVLRETADALEAMRANEDHTDANSIGEMIAGDPMMTLKVLAHASEHRSDRVVTQPETVTAALVMMGISPFFSAFPAQRSIEDLFADRAWAMDGLARVLERARRGADFALGFAIHRTDPNAAAIHAGALLHEFSEMLLWLHAPRLALHIQRAQDDDPALRSSAAQRAVLNIELVDLQAQLVAGWQLPALLTQAHGDLQGRNASARTVALASSLARHTAHGWKNAAVPDDIDEIALLLNLSPEATLDLVRDIDPA